MNWLKFLVLPLYLAGCSCDSICESQKQTKKLLANYSSSSELIAYLNKYNGEAPGSEMYNVFVNWGVKNPEKFISVINHEEVDENMLRRVTYQISDQGLKKHYCDLYSIQTKGHNIDRIIQLLDCKR